MARIFESAPVFILPIIVEIDAPNLVGRCNEGDQGVFWSSGICDFGPSATSVPENMKSSEIAAHNELLLPISIKVSRRDGWG
jgi:hypothetical protein